MCSVATDKEEGYSLRVDPPTKAKPVVTDKPRLKYINFDYLPPVLSVQLDSRLSLFTKAATPDNGNSSQRNHQNTLLIR